MTKKRLPVRTIKELLRLSGEYGLSIRKMAKSCDIGRSTVSDYLVRFQQAGLKWPISPDMDDDEIEKRLFPEDSLPAPAKLIMPPMDYLYRELKKKSVTLQLLWHEYKEINPEGYQYSYFCDLYRKWAKKIDVSLRQEHKAGEKLFVDFAGQAIPIIDSLTGEITDAQLFVATLGASNYTFCEATLSQDLLSWIKLHIHAFQFFGGVPQILVPDNLKAGVKNPSAFFEDAGVGLQDGVEFDAPGFVRLNFGCPRGLLEDALNRMAKAMADV